MGPEAVTAEVPVGARVARPRGVGKAVIRVAWREVATVEAEAVGSAVATGAGLAGGLEVDSEVGLVVAMVVGSAVGSVADSAADSAVGSAHSVAAISRRRLSLYFQARSAERAMIEAVGEEVVGLAAALGCSACSAWSVRTPESGSGASPGAKDVRSCDRSRMARPAP